MNFELPNVAEDYVHRIGRTGRAEATGMAVSLVCIDEAKLLKDIEKLLKKPIPKMVIDGYEPDPSIKAEPIQKTPQRNERRSGGDRSGQPRRNNPPSAGSSSGKGSSSPWKNAQKKVKQGRNDG
ncbi:hypothetical protein MASR2M36_38830 [Providencia sp.]